MSKTGWIVALILAIICVFLYLHRPAPPPSVIPGVTMRVDTVIIHDTIYTIKHRGDITVRLAPVKTAANAPKIDSTAPPSETIAIDTPVCYSFSEEYKNGAYVQAEMCSRFFPENRPEDLEGAITYHPGNDTMKLFSRVDTVPKIIFKPPKIPTWQAITIGAVLGLAGGYLIAK
jgi:hypothetical protein